jgi:hypothetical protein
VLRNQPARNHLVTVWMILNPPLLVLRTALHGDLHA